MILGDFIERNEALFSAKEGVVDERCRLSFGQFAERCRRLANALAGRGVGHGDRIAVLAPNCHEYVEAFGASELAGYITTPLNVRSAPAELADLLTDCAPTAMIFDASFTAAVEALRPVLTSVKSYICIGDAPGWAEPYEAVLTAASTAPPPTRAAPDDTAFLMYTSGSTGRPKGVMQGHRGQIEAAMSMTLDGDVEATDRILIANPLFHSGGKWMVMTHHLRGAGVFLLRHFDAGTFLEIVERERITTTLLPATMLQAILDHPDFATRDHSSLRTVYYSAGPTPVALLRRALATFGPIMLQYYGGTEWGGIGTAMLKHQHVLDGTETEQRRLASAGQVMPLGKLRIVREDGTDCDADEPGEIIVHSDALMQGYWNNPGATEEAVRDGWFYTGDVGTRDAEHFIFVIDRKKEMIISGGANIYSREVEDALHRHAGVLEAAVIGVPHEKWGETVHAVVALRAGESLTAEELIEHCRPLIASYKKPTSVAFVDRLPKLENGKIDKLSLREPFWAGRERRVN